MSERKTLLLRLDPAVHDALQRWANDELRSTNAQMEMVLRDALRRAGRLPKDVKPIRKPGRPPARRNKGDDRPSHLVQIRLPRPGPGDDVRAQRANAGSSSSTSPRAEAMMPKVTNRTALMIRATSGTVHPLVIPCTVPTSQVPTPAIR